MASAGALFFRPLFEPREEAGQVIGQGGIEDHPLPCSGMAELQVRGVQKLARRHWRLWAAIGQVASDGMMQRRQMHANLVGAPRLKLHFE